MRKSSQALENRICKDRPLAVLVGSAGFAAALDYLDILRKSNVTVIHASSSDATAWSQNAPGTPPDYPEFVRAYRTYLSPEEGSLADGYAIAHHDAFVTAARAIRLAASSRSTHVPDPQNVASNGFSLLNLDYEVPAASGKLSFPPEHGRATGRFVPLQQINRDTVIQLPADLEPYVVQ
ncbi:MAG: hypothetical protein LC799_17885 [Actinobacteria bacterium]|nr:hypothetical protein [Actinomycetota bacterium]